MPLSEVTSFEAMNDIMCSLYYVVLKRPGGLPEVMLSLPRVKTSYGTLPQVAMPLTVAQPLCTALYHNRWAGLMDN